MASKKIRGITIQLGADASPIQKALKETEKTSKDLNYELGRVNKLLKFDPGNTTLLAQKQKILAESIGNTETKLNALRQAQGKVEEMFKAGDIGEKEYREFQRTIVDTEQSLKSYTTQMSRMKEEQSKLETGTKQLNTFLEATGKSLDDFQDVLGTRLTNALKNGTANSDDLTIALNKIGKEALGTETDLAEMRNALNRIDEGNIDDVRNSLQELKGDSGDAETSLNDIGKGVSAGNLMEAGEQIAGLGDKVIELGKEAQDTALQFQDSTAKIKSALGLTDEQAEETGDVIKTVFESGVTDSIDEATQAVLISKQAFSELNNTDLAEITRQIKSIADTTGTDVQENVNATKKVMQNFGLSAQDSLDLIAAGYQNGLNSQGDFLDTLNEYGPYFSQAGMSASDFLEILNSGMDAGAFNTDKVADAVKEFQIRLGDGTFEKNMGSFSESTQDLFHKWQDGKATVKDVFESVGNDLRNMPVEDQQAALSTLSTQFEDLGIDASLALFDIGGEFDNVKGKAKDMASQTPGEKMQGDLNKLRDALAPIGEDIQNAIAPILELLADIADKFSKLPEPVRNFIEVFAGFGALVAIIMPVIAIIATLQPILAGLVLSIGGLNLTLLPIIGIIAAIVAIVTAVILVIKNWGAITDWLSEKWNAFKDWIGNLWQGIKDTAVGVWNGIKDTLSGLWSGLKDKALSIFGGMWDGIKNGFTNLKDSIGSIVKKIANAIVKPIGGAVNGVIKGINWILDKFGSDKKLNLWDVPQFAGGTGGLRKDTIGMVNDQKGSTYKEMIVPPHGQPFIPEGRDVVLPMEKGTKIMPARDTKSFLESLPHFAKGIGELFGGVWETVKSFTGSIWDYISHPGKIVQIAIDKFTDLAGVVEPVLSIAKGAVGSVFDNAVGFIKKIFDEQANVNYNPSAGTEQWRKLASRALQMTGQYNEGNLNRLLYQMQTESGGNPNAINNWDINAQNGIPSKGLMQVIDPTFRAYAMPGYDKNIYDPLSNMLASIRYALANYGSLAAAYRGTGYANGIGDINLSDLIPSLPVLDVKWFKEGGILTKPSFFQTGKGIGGAGEAGAEAIAPVQKLKDYVQDAVLEIMGNKNINLTVNLTGLMDGRAVAQGTVQYTQPLLNERDERLKRLRGER